MRVYIAVFALCAIAAIMTSQPNNGATLPEDCPQDKADNHAVATQPQEQHHEATNDPSRADDNPPQWYASLKRPEWWLVILGFPTLAVLAWQAIVGANAAKAALLNAVAARQAVAVVVSKERCRISIKPWGRLHLPYRSDPATHEPIFDGSAAQGANYDIEFYGLTEGYISEAVAGACLSNSEDVPNVSPSPIRDLPKRILATEQKELAKTARLLPRMESIDDVIDVVEGRKFIHCWGVIRYRDAFYDAFLQERETSFRWVWKFTRNSADLAITTPSGGRFGTWQKCGPPEDNRET